MKAKLYFLETRPQFLLLAVVLGILGACIAWYDGSFNWGDAVLAGFGLVLAHASCNALNDYFDYKSGVDKLTNVTPFSGGSGLIKQGLLTSREVFWFGMICLLIDIPIGLYFCMTKGWLLLPLILVAVFCIIFYSPLVLRAHWPEWSPGLGLGILPILGMYFSQTGAYTWHALIASIPAGFLVHNLLLLNEFPDTEADKAGGRKTLPITMGHKGAAIVYTVVTILVYIWIAGAAAFSTIPFPALLGLLTIPLAIKAIRGSFQSEDTTRLMPAMASNVMVVLLTQFLMAAGYLLSGIFNIQLPGC
ncbi:MAG: prenyltransferase [Dehalococcoidia bacterium]|nr:prenyltransferase [Dehalococcoidia bacterium]